MGDHSIKSIQLLDDLIHKSLCEGNLDQAFDALLIKEKIINIQELLFDIKAREIKMLNKSLQKEKK